MRGEQFPLSQSPFAKLTWPTDGCVALILDGASIPQIGQSIYEWSDGAVDAECLYASTRWESVSEFAPWLVWLKSDDHLVVRQFLERGARREWGYFLMSGHGPDVLRTYLGQLLVIERAPGCEELLRMAHPEMARSIIGERQIRPLPELPVDVVQRIVSPNLVTGTWVIQEPAGPSEGVNDPQSFGDVESLNATFLAFNRRRNNLLLWDLLDSHMREWLGGASLSAAYTKLSSKTFQAEQQGHRNPREQMRYLLEQFRKDEQTRIDASNELNLMDEQ